MLKILVVDDHPVVRRGLKQILTEEPDIELVGEAETSGEVLDLIHTHDWDAVVLDITMPGRGGLDILKELKREHPRLPVLILSVHPEDQYAVRVLKEGAAGYMNKECAPEELTGALRKIIRGGKYVSLALAEKLAFMLESQAPLHDSLSTREYQVMLMLASGKTLSQIAEEMSLSIKTIATYRARILEKMNMKNNAEMIHYAIKHNLV
ncbi:MAG TPA: response regulator transcription factor [Syntrophorhabdales bacterium]|nr:response regulator transcription factor [Syntrophorhabdales bacterium]